MTTESAPLNNSTLSGDLVFEEDRFDRIIMRRLTEEAQLAGMPLDAYLKANNINLKSQESFWKNPPNITIDSSG